MTSHDVISFLRRLIGIKRIGHLGTLDPGAAGTLPIAVGATATRVIDQIPDSGKSYRVELQLGLTSDTGDLFGKLTPRVVSRIPTESELSSLLQQFIGEQLQTPPLASAIKINGKKLYEYHRKQIEITPPQRKITIYSIELYRYDFPYVLFEVSCSAGTYIRSLCADIGEKLNMGGVTSFLLRTRSGSFHISQAVSREELLSYGTIPESLLISPVQLMGDRSIFTLSSEQLQLIHHGASIALTEPIEQFSDIVILQSSEGTLAAIAEPHREGTQISLKPKKVFI